MDIHRCPWIFIGFIHRCPLLFIGFTVGSDGVNHGLEESQLAAQCIEQVRSKIGHAIVPYLPSTCHGAVPAITCRGAVPAMTGHGPEVHSEHRGRLAQGHGTDRSVLVDGWEDGWKDGWANRWTDGRIDG